MYKTDNETDVCKGIRFLFQQLQEEYLEKDSTLYYFHIIKAHDINLSIKECIE